jgi:hypothetical protein
MTLVHRSIFRRAIQLAFHKTVRPPSKKHLGTNLRKIDPLPCIPEIFHELTSTARGLPETSPLEGILRPSPPGYPQRKQGDSLLPIKTSSVRKLYGAKLQRQDSVKAVCRFEDFEPRTSLGAVRMMLRREPNEQGTGRSWQIKAFGMAAQLKLKYSEPLGKASMERFAMLSAKMNVLLMDPTTAKITFGVINYEPWTKKWLRWEFYDQVEQLAARPNLKVPIPSELLATIAERKADPLYAMKPSWTSLQ